MTEELIVLKREKLHYFDGNLFQYQKQEKNQFKHARRQQEALDKKRGVIEKSITEAKRQAKKSGDENKQRMVKSREKKLQDRWGLEVNAAGHRFKVRYIGTGCDSSASSLVVFASYPSSIETLEGTITLAEEKSKL